jgi:hypothetical protein
MINTILTALVLFAAAELVKLYYHKMKTKEDDDALHRKRPGEFWKLPTLRAKKRNHERRGSTGSL